MCVRTCKNIA